MWHDKLFWAGECSHRVDQTVAHATETDRGRIFTGGLPLIHEAVYQKNHRPALRTAGSSPVLWMFF